ncbi:MAG: DUF4139 domain-containing protein [bacterium]
MARLLKNNSFLFLILTSLFFLYTNLTCFSGSRAIAETKYDNNDNVSPIKLSGTTNIETTENDRKEIVLSIYNNNFALVKEVREIYLPSGISELRFLDISRHINPGSVITKSINNINGLEFIEQNYEYDLISPENLLDKYVGHTVTLIDKDDFSGSKGKLQAELLSNSHGPIYRIGEEIHIGHPGRIVLPKLPEGLLTEPSLIWKLDVTDSGKYTLDVSYLTEELDWNVDYSLVLNSDNTRGDLSGWVTIKNNSGTSFKQARIQLVAGKVARVREPKPVRFKETDNYEMLSKGVSEEGIFEYHLYNLPSNMTLKDREMKQVRLFSTERIPVKKELRYYGEQQYYQQRYREGTKTQGIGIYLEFENRKTFHLGIPLPEGIIRVYESDSDGSVQFLGEDRIPHTPEDGMVRVQTGYASDIIAERKQMEWRKPSSELIEAIWEIIFKNYKNKTAWIVLMESVPGDWEIMECSHHWRKEDAHTLRFDISVAPKSEEKVRYKIRIHL